MVDEFQDTNPIQLSLFLALNELVGRSIWVGDSKQAIYRFRGTDPLLMNEVVSLIGKTKILDCSWRSRKKLVEFTNAIFSEVFHEMNENKVCLDIPTQRKA
jgi:ATP-dependent exoDNAse (exonuclease V) beta subunit